MNFVAHLFLSPCNDAFRVGSILADFTVGKMDQIEESFGPDISVGIRHHREVDRFTDSHDAVCACVNAMKDSFGIYGAIVSDVMFDHFLLRHWKRYCTISKETFFASVYQSLTLMRPEFPRHYQVTVRRMLERRWLHTYEDVENTAYALQRIGERFTRKTPLSDALPGLKQHYDVLENTFLLFFPQLQRFSDELISEIFEGRARADAR